MRCVFARCREQPGADRHHPGKHEHAGLLRICCSGFSLRAAACFAGACRRLRGLEGGLAADRHGAAVRRRWRMRYCGEAVLRARAGPHSGHAWDGSPAAFLATCVTSHFAGRHLGTSCVDAARLLLRRSCSLPAFVRVRWLLGAKAVPSHQATCPCRLGRHKAVCRLTLSLASRRAAPPQTLSPSSTFSTMATTFIGACVLALAASVRARVCRAWWEHFGAGRVAHAGLRGRRAPACRAPAVLLAPLCAARGWRGSAVRRAGCAATGTLCTGANCDGGRRGPRAHAQAVLTRQIPLALQASAQTFTNCNVAKQQIQQVRPRPRPRGEQRPRARSPRWLAPAFPQRAAAAARAIRLRSGASRAHRRTARAARRNRAPPRGCWRPHRPRSARLPAPAARPQPAAGSGQPAARGGPKSAAFSVAGARAIPLSGGFLNARNAPSAGRAPATVTTCARAAASGARLAQRRVCLVPLSALLSGRNTAPERHPCFLKPPVRPG
jgi:hypothetical protein